MGWVLAARFELAGAWQVEARAGFVATWFLITYATNSSLRRFFLRSNYSPSLILCGPILILGWMWLAHMPEDFTYRQLVLAAASGALGSWAGPALMLQARRTRSCMGEALRWLGLAGVCLWLIHPYATPHLVGGGDAHHYAQQLADASRQVRQGEFQLFVGQSAFAFNGDIHPLRTAPYFSYIGAAVSLITGPSFAPTAVQNLLIVGSLCSAVALIYALLTRLRPQTAWPAFWLTTGFAACPGVLTLIYSGDMVASWLTLPWLPLVFYATIRSWSADNPVPSLRLLAGSLAMVWLAHPPIAFWTSLLVGLSLATRVVVRWERGRSLWLVTACGATCLLLCGYVFVSVKTLQLPVDPGLVTFVRHGGMLEILRAGWAGIGQPVDPAGADLIRNLQLSPALWLAAIIGMASVRRHRWSAGALLVGACGMLVLLYPSAHVSGRLWTLMPASVISATDKWPMQRFYPILSVVVPFLALLAWPQKLSFFRRAWVPHVLLTALSAAVIFSLYDARKFVARGYAVTSSAEMSERRLRPENVVLSRYSYEYFGRLPRVFTHGTVSPWMQNRLLARNTLAPIDSNLLALDQKNHTGIAPLRTRHRFIATEYGGRYVPPLRLEPNHRYFVRFVFGAQPATGTLQLLGRYIYREYPLPTSGEDLAFGMGTPRRNGFSLWTTAPVADDVEMRFYKQPDTPPTANLGDVELLAVNPNQLPLQLLSVHPYQIAVRASTDTWLETPKIFLPGYIAEIDGVSAPVERSPDGLTMIPVPAGQHRVHLSYLGPPALRAAFWTTFIAWLVLLTAWGFRRQLAPVTGIAFIHLGRATVALTVIALISFGATRAYAAFSTTAPRANLAVAPVEVHFTLPVGLEKQWQKLWQFEHAGATWSIHCYYENGQNARIGLARGTALHAVSEAFQINYLRQHRLIATLQHAPKGAPPQLRVWVNQRLVLRPKLNPNIAYGGGAFAETPFDGHILRIATSEGPID